LQQLKLILNFNHEQKKFKADEVKHFKEDILPCERTLKQKLRTEKGRYYPLYCSFNEPCAL